MFDNLKKLYYFNKRDLLIKQGLLNGSIVPFDKQLYEKMSHTYISCIPVSMHIKYLRPIITPGRCFDRSLYMFLCFDDALLVRGNNKELELLYGKEDAGHGWIEIDNYVYDPTLLLRFEKDAYYKIYSPTNVYKCSKDDYIKDNKSFYEQVKNVTLQDFKPNGRKRIDLCSIIPLLEEIVNASNNPDFKNDFNNYLQSINYDERQVVEEMNLEFQKYLSK